MLLEYSAERLECSAVPLEYSAECLECFTELLECSAEPLEYSAEPLEKKFRIEKSLSIPFFHILFTFQEFLALPWQLLRYFSLPVELF